MEKKEWLRSLKFLLFSCSAGLLQIGSFTLFNELLHFPYWVSYLLALVISVIWNFTFNRKYTFRSTEKVGRAMSLVFAYYLVFTPLSTLLEHQLADVMGWNEYLVTAINMVLNFVTEFLYQRFVVYRNSLDTNAAAQKEREAGQGFDGDA
ncbi:MAG: GtrA family protein [Firmicutes bacterium]|nr:GtrA family protein [Bacillota bacterium]